MHSLRPSSTQRFPFPTVGKGLLCLVSDNSATSCPERKEGKVYSDHRVGADGVTYGPRGRIGQDGPSQSTLRGHALWDDDPRACVMRCGPVTDCSRLVEVPGRLQAPLPNRAGSGATRGASDSAESISLHRPITEPWVVVPARSNHWRPLPVLISRISCVHLSSRFFLRRRIGGGGEIAKGHCRPRRKLDSEIWREICSCISAVTAPGTILFGSSGKVMQGSHCRDACGFFMSCHRGLLHYYCARVFWTERLALSFA